MGRRSRAAVLLLCGFAVSCAHFNAEALALAAARRDFPRCAEFSTSGEARDGTITVRVCGVPYSYEVTPLVAERVR